MESELSKRIDQRGWVISNIPSWAKETIKEMAELEHNDSYGHAIAQCVREANEYRVLKSKFFNNELGIRLSLENEDKETSEKITLANGKKLNSGGNKI